MRMLLSLAIALSLASSAFGEEVKVYAAAVVKSPLVKMAADYEAATGNTVVCVFDTAGATEQKFRADPAAALLITTETLIGDRMKSGTLKDGITVRLGAVVAGIAVPPGTPKPDISTPEKLKIALLSAPRIAFSDPARGATVGTHFVKVIEALGIKDQVMRKATVAPDGVETMRLVLEKKADLGVSQTSEIVQANRDALVGPFPKEFDLSTTFALWYSADISSAARGFAVMLTSAAGREKLTAEGFR
ncbi:MAG TPA: substrate-binding domain-containing protein [Vicinamibacterales bacterium]|jgi:molybdate transport system substrate-binding protein|nr:substrate-binding domain-containing protein [Vicinamibacterales bacterium]